MFMVAGYNDTDANFATTMLISPGFLGSEHPKECLSFWYTIGVSTLMAGRYNLPPASISFMQLDG